jgi:hypothetical protein
MSDRQAVYPDWSLCVFLDETVPQSFLLQLLEGGCRIVHVDANIEPNGMMWRYDINALEGFDRVIFRDADSRLTVKERNAVNEWVASKKPLHLMRDHPFHKYPILGGMFGVVLDSEPGKSLMSIKSNSVDYGSDIDALSRCLGDYFNPEFAMVHDEFFFSNGAERPFPGRGATLSYVGEVSKQALIRMLTLRLIRVLTLLRTRVFGREPLHDN